VNQGHFVNQYGIGYGNDYQITSSQARGIVYITTKQDRKNKNGNRSGISPERF